VSGNLRLDNTNLVMRPSRGDSPFSPAGIAAATGDRRGLYRSQAAAAFHLPVLAPYEVTIPDYQDIVARVKAPATGNLGASLVGGPSMTLDEAPTTLSSPDAWLRLQRIAEANCAPGLADDARHRRDCVEHACP